MAVQLLSKEKTKSNWKRMLDAANLLQFEDGKLVAGKGWKIDDMDCNSISSKLTTLNINHEIDGLYKIIIS
jgi:hypothetical protein